MKRKKYAIEGKEEAFYISFFNIYNFSRPIFQPMHRKKVKSDTNLVVQNIFNEFAKRKINLTFLFKIFRMYVTRSFIALNSLF